MARLRWPVSLPGGLAALPSEAGIAFLEVDPVHPLDLGHKRLQPRQGDIGIGAQGDAGHAGLERGGIQYRRPGNHRPTAVQFFRRLHAAPAQRDDSVNRLFLQPRL